MAQGNTVFAELISEVPWWPQQAKDSVLSFLWLWLLLWCRFDR